MVVGGEDMVRTWAQRTAQRDCGIVSEFCIAGVWTRILGIRGLAGLGMFLRPPGTGGFQTRPYRYGTGRPPIPT